MSLFRKFFYRKPPDGLLEISERVYVFDSCYATGMLEDDAYRLYIGGIVSQLRDDFPDASFMVFNFRDGEYRSQIAGILCEYDMTVMDYPRQYEGCPLLTLEMIHHFLRSGESWLSLGQQNVILVHCEQGGWPILAFMLAALLIYRKQFTGEQKTLDMIYKQAPYELLQLMSPVNPLPSQIRYLQYVSRRNVGSQWPPLDRALTLDCIILRFIPNIDGEGGCRPIFRIFGQDPLMVPDKSAKVLFATPKRSKLVRYYKQTDCELVKIDIHCHVQGDVVLECISLDGDLEREAMVFRVMFNTAFIRSNILMLNHDEIDILWNAKDQFPKDFRVEALFSEMDAANSVIPIDLPTIEDKEGLPVEAFSKVQEIFSAVDWSDPKTDVALNVLQHLSAANLLQENTSSPKLGVLLDSAFKDETKLKFYEDYIMSPTSPLGKQSIASIKNEPQDMQTALPQPLQSAPSPNPSIDSNTTKNSSENLEVEYSLKEPISMLPKDEISVRENSPICMLSKDVISVREYSEPKELQVASPKSEQSLLFSEPSADKNSNRQKTGAKDHKVAFHGPMLDMLSCKPSRDEPKEHQVSLQLPAQSKILSPRLPISPISTRISQCTSLQGSSVPLSRYHSAPSALGITALLHDHAESTEQTIDSVTLPSSSSATSSALIDTPKNLQLSYVSTPLPVPPPPPAQSSSESSLSKKALVLPPPPPPPPPIVVASKEIDAKHPCPPPPPSYLGRSHSVMSSNSTPPPPPPLPPCFGTSPSSTITKLFPSSSPLPPPPPPSGISPSVRNSSSAPPPPPLPPVATAYSNSSQQQTGVSVPPPPLLPGSKHVSSSPPPPPPPSFASRGSSANNSTCAPSAPPPPAPSAKGISTDATASLHPHSAVNNGNVPAIPGLPSARLNSKGRGLSRPGARSQAQTKKANLKPYHWLKLTRAMQGSLWAEAQKPDEASKAPEIDLLELESLFSAAVPDKTTGRKSSRIASGPKLEKVQLIELRRAYNCEIMLSKVKIPLPELMSSVLTLDDSTLDVDQVENLIKFCPTKEEMELMKGYNGDKDNLGKCEQFFLELMKAPRIESKLRVFSFKIQFHSQVSDLRKNLNIVNSAAEEVKKSVKLKRIMQTILTIGNALNHGTARGSAIGFRLDSLLKLTDTRAQNNKMTLMHYLCKVVADKLPESLDFPKDLVSLEAATKIQLKYLAEEMQAISKGLEKVVQELTASENDGPVSEIFCKTLKEFLSFAEGEVRSLASLYSSVGRNADALALYFGEDPARCPFEQVVSTMLNFVRMFRRAHEENCKHIELEKKKALKDAENEKPTVSTPRRGAQHMQQSTINSGNIR